MKSKSQLLDTLAVASGALALSLAWTSQAVEQENFRFKSTEDLYQLCDTAPTSENYVPSIYACRGFLAGAVQYHDAVTDRKHLKRLICYGPEATLETGRQTFVQWAKAHADDAKLMAEPPVIGVVRALAAKYPCGE
jgi:hypothetical protein